MRSTVQATDVTVTTSRYTGIQATKLRLRNVDLDGNDGLAGVLGSQVIGQHVTANDNGMAFPPAADRGDGQPPERVSAPTACPSSVAP